MNRLSKIRDTRSDIHISNVGVRDADFGEAHGVARTVGERRKCRFTSFTADKNAAAILVLIVVAVREGGVAVASRIATTRDVVSFTLGAESASIGGAKETVDSNGIGVAGSVRRNGAAVSRRRRVISVVFRNGVLCA